jgi:hypothetical protein
MLEQGRTKPEECSDFNGSAEDGGILWHTGLERYVLIYDIIQYKTETKEARLRKLSFCPFCGKGL